MLLSGDLYRSELISGEDHLSRTPYRIYREEVVMKMKDRHEKLQGFSLRIKRRNFCSGVF